MFSILMQHIHLTKIADVVYMVDNDTNNLNTAVLQQPEQHNVEEGPALAANYKGNRKNLPLIITAAIIVIAIILVMYYTVQKPSTVQTIPTTSTITNTNTSNSSVTTIPRIIKPIHEPESYLVANAFANNYNFSSPLKYRFTAVFQPSYNYANCTSMEGLVGYMQNESMISKPYNISSLSDSEPVGEYAAVLGVNPSNIAEYSTLFNSNGGFCTPSFAASLANSTSQKTRYSYGNTTVYIFTMSNITKNGLNVFGSYLGPKPNLTVYMGSAMYGNYRVKVLVAGFSSTASKLGLYGNAVSLTNSTISYLKSYLSSHSISP
jgi:hypothetical protein